MVSTLNQELLRKLDIRLLTVDRTRAGRWWNYKQVVSPFARLWMILDGRGTVQHSGRKFSLTPGQLHLVPPFTVHTCSCSSHLEHYHLHFTSRLPTGIDLLALLDNEFQVSTPPETPGLMQRLLQIYPNRKLPCFDPSRDEYRRQSLKAASVEADISAAEWLEASGILRILLALFLRNARPHQGAHARATQQFLILQEFIHENMHKALLLGDLARVVGLNPTYFSDRFLSLVGMRPLEYLMLRRMERAQYLLLTTNASVKQVAVEVGVPDPAYFNRVFKRFSGASPGDYRRSHAN